MYLTSICILFIYSFANWLSIIIIRLILFNLLYYYFATLLYYATISSHYLFATYSLLCDVQLNSYACYYYKCCNRGNGGWHRVFRG